MITSAMLARQVIVPAPLPIELTPLVRYSCSLLPAPKKVNSFGIKQIQTLFAKHPGWGYLPQVRLGLPRFPYRFLSPFLFITLRNPFPATPLFSHSYKTPEVSPSTPAKIRCTFPNQEFSLCLCASGQNLRDVQTFRNPTFAGFSATMGALRQGHNCATDEAASD
jgi:hypothetical protein